MPWGRLDDGLYDHPKLDDLGGQRLPAIGLWTLAISWSNRWLTDGHVPFSRVRALGGSATIADRLVTAGLFEKVDDGYLIHDFLEFNDSRADVEAKRSAEREKKRIQRRNGHAKVGRHDASGQFVSPKVSPPLSPEDTHRDTRRESPAIPTRPDPSRESLERGSTSTRESTERPDVQALLDRGWKRVTKAQHAVLDEVLDRHDVTGPAFAAEVIRATPLDADPLESVMAADRLWQEHQRTRADADELATAKAKETERAEAAEVKNGSGPISEFIASLGE